MAKYKLKSLSVQLGGRVVRKKHTPQIDGKDYPEADLKSAEKGGFIEQVKSKPKPAPKAPETKKSK